METEIINITPTWEENAAILCTILESGNNKSFARDELIKMGRKIDELNEAIDSEIDLLESLQKRDKQHMPFFR